ncbi:hypothetical protein JW964_03400 [candidate division KSB1 bacterium]|nr:hypothetical protein [candidate division KSB1 bacterium]
MNRNFILLLVMVILANWLACSDKNPVQAEKQFIPAPVENVAEWQVDPSNYEHFMTIVAQVDLNSERQCGVNNKIAAFCGQEVRGIAVPYQHIDCVLYNLLIYSNSAADTISFGVYLVDKNAAVALRNEIIFESGAGLGHPDSPYVLEVQ